MPKEIREARVERIFARIAAVSFIACWCVIVSSLIYFNWDNTPNLIGAIIAVLFITGAIAATISVDAKDEDK